MAGQADLLVLLKARDEMSSVFQNAHGHVTALGGVVSGVAGGLATFGLAVQGVKAAVDIVGGAIHGLIGPAQEAQAVSAQLDAVLASTGGAAGVTRAEILGMADSLSRLTPFEDEAVMSGQSLLLTFTNIGRDVFPRATETMLNMSQALGQDLKSSAIQLGKALNDPIQGMTALQRVGVSFTEEQKAMVEELVKTGDLMGAQSLILNELEIEFGGAARAAGQTFGGALTILQTQLGNFVEVLGGPVIEVLQEFAQKGAGFIAGFLDHVNALADDLELDPLTAALAAVRNELERTFGPDTARLFEVITQGVQDLVDAFFAMVDGAEEASGGFAEVIETISGAILQMIDIVQTALSGDLTTAFGDLVANLQAVGGDIGDALQQWARAFVGFAEDAEEAVDVGVGDVIGKLLQMLADATPGILAQLSEWAGMFWAWIVEATPQMIGRLGDLSLALLEWITDQGPPLLKTFISEWVPAFVGWVLGTALPEIIKALAGIIVAIGQWALESSPKLVEFGFEIARAIIEGVNQGIINLRTMAWNAMKDFANGMIQAAKDALRAESPSEEFAIVGESIPQGTAVGIRRAAGTAMTAIDGFMKELVNAAAQYTAQFGQAGGSLAAALDVALREGTAQAGANVAKALQKVVTDMRQIGVNDWREMGDALAGAVHDAIVMKTPEAVGAVHEMLEAMMAEFDVAKAQATAGAFMKGVGDAILSQEMIDRFGQVGARAAEALWLAFEGDAKAAKTAGDAIAKMISEAEKLAIPNARALGQQIIEFLFEGINDREGEMLGMGLELMEQFAFSIREAKGEIENAAAFTIDTLNAALSRAGSSSAAEFGRIGSDLMRTLQDAIVRGGASTIEKLGEQAQKMMDELGRHLRPERAAELGRQLLDALRRVAEEQTPEAVAAFSALMGAIQTELSGNGSRKILDSIAKLGDDLLRTLRLKLPPEQGGGLMNVFLASVNAAIAGGTAEGERQALGYAEKVFAAILTRVSPEVGTIIAQEFTAALQQAFETGDMSGLLAYANRIEERIAELRRELGAIPITGSPPAVSPPRSPPGSPPVSPPGSPPSTGNCPNGQVVVFQDMQCHQIGTTGPCGPGRVVAANGTCVSYSSSPVAPPPGGSPPTSPPGGGPPTSPPPYVGSPPPNSPPATQCGHNRCYLNGVWYNCWEIPANAPNRGSCNTCCPGYSFEFGGVVPGSIGQPVSAIVHGGEMIIPSGVAQQMLHGGGGSGSGAVAITVDMRGAQIFGIEDLDRRVLSAVTNAFRRGGLSFLTSRAAMP